MQQSEVSYWWNTNSHNEQTGSTSENKMFWWKHPKSFRSRLRSSQFNDQFEDDRSIGKVIARPTGTTSNMGFIFTACLFMVS